MNLRIWSHRTTSYLIVAALTVLASCVQLSTYPNHDVAWVLWGTRELLNGAAWGQDILEANPPLAWFLAMPTTALAMATGVPLDWTFRSAVALAAAASALSLTWLAPKHQPHARSAALTVTAGAALLLLPGREFGQREHLLVIAILPYLMLSAGLMKEGSAVAWWSALAIGLIAGLGVALKPYFLVIPLLVELCVQGFARKRPRLIRPENLGGALVMVLYTLWLLVFERIYLEQVIPLASQIYWSYDLPLDAILPRLALWALPAIPLGALLVAKRDSVGIVLTAAALGLIFSYLVQHKGYAYHVLPVTIVTLMLATCALTVERLSVAARVAIGLLFAFLVGLTATPLRAWWVVNRPGGSRTAEIDRVKASLAKHAPNAPFLVIAVHHHPAFPVALYTTSKWASRTNSQWFLSALAQVREGRAVDNRYEIERNARTFVIRDLRQRPAIVMVDTNSARHTRNSGKFDFLAFFMEDATFREEWQAYREIEPVGSFRQFVRRPSELAAGEELGEVGN